MSARSDDPPEGVAAMPWELIAIGDDGRSAVIRYLPTIACYQEAGVWARYDHDRVLLAPLAEDGRSNTACSLAAQEPNTVVVEFSEDLAGRDLRSLPIDDKLTEWLDQRCCPPTTVA
ncbi:hypothetical protein [Actinoalloteichus hymeniacidonis]|uniref:Uncharacterized protein n=1 Tax=Actinoalloteichus hymeniacidonis TaxID=340345 RepID=A0AAC9HTG4_9PSEU|nr:hypothetical protein [Actinoalloteichus hymeniacidonis]AOS65269.1 hypothetical protein TL08_22435 [Actinoalloteichus hymeniacidonis]MBB5906649.1 hypothetical protein [Actinoalloteichus hymeniacidonis]